MKQYFIGRMFAWGVGALTSLGLAVVCALGILAVTMLTPARHQDLLGAGIGIFTMVFIWPGLLTFSLIFADGFALEGFSKNLLVRSILWGSIPSALIVILNMCGINWVALADMVGGKEPRALISLFFFVSPSLIAAFLGIRLRLASRESSI